MELALQQIAQWLHNAAEQTEIITAADVLARFAKGQGHPPEGGRSDHEPDDDTFLMMSATASTIAWCTGAKSSMATLPHSAEILHVVDGERHNGVNTLLADPLRRGQLGKARARVIRIAVFIQIGKRIGLGKQSGTKKVS